MLPGSASVKTILKKMCATLILTAPAFVFADAAQLQSSDVNYQSIARFIEVDATIEAINKATVSAQTSGRITEINFDVDDFVPRDSVIMRFRDTKQKAALDQAQAAVKEAQTRLVEAQKEFQRIEDVYRKKLVSKAQYDKAQANQEASTQQLGQAKAQLVQAREEHDRTIVRAPYAGIVIKKHVQAGETARVGQPLMTGFSMKAMRATAKVPQKFIGLIKPENKAYVETGALSMLDGPGVFEEVKESREVSKISISPFGDPDTHSYDVRLYFENVTANLMPGMHVKARFQVGESRHLLVPDAAVVRRGEVTAVYVIGGTGKVSYRQVRTGKELISGQIEVLAGLDAGEKVATDPGEAVALFKQQQINTSQTQQPGN